MPSGLRLRLGEGEASRLRGAGRLRLPCAESARSAPELEEARELPEESRAEAPDEPLRDPRELRDAPEYDERTPGESCCSTRGAGLCVACERTPGEYGCSSTRGT